MAGISVQSSPKMISITLIQKTTCLGADNFMIISSLNEFLCIPHNILIFSSVLQKVKGKIAPGTFTNQHEQLEDDEEKVLEKASRCL